MGLVPSLGAACKSEGGFKEGHPRPALPPPSRCILLIPGPAGLGCIRPVRSEESSLHTQTLTEHPFWVRPRSRLSKDKARPCLMELTFDRDRQTGSRIGRGDTDMCKRNTDNDTRGRLK